MNVTVRFWGVAKRLAGTDALAVQVAAGSTVADLSRVLAGQGGLAPELPRCAWAIGDDLVPRTHTLREGDEVAVLPPVSGG